MLTIDDIGKSFGANIVLDGVKAVFRPGCVYAMLGPNGAGKSTLLNILAGFLSPTKGSVTLAGRRIDGMPPAAVARLGVRMVFQTTRLWETMTVYENLVTAWEHAGGSDAGLIDRALALTGLERYANGLPSRMSAGQRRILSIAQALVADPRVLLLDEPSAALDRRNAERVFAYMSAIDRADRTIIIVEHNLELLAGFAGEALFLYGGVVRADGPFAEIVARPDIRTLYLGLVR